MAAKKPRYERVVQLKAADGTLHPTYADAQKYEAAKKLADWLDEYMDLFCDHEPPSAQHLAEALRAEWNISQKRSKT